MLMREKDDLRDCLFAYGRSPSDLTSDRVQTSADPDRLVALISKIDAKEKQIVRRIDALVDLKEKVSGQIQKLQDPRYAELLHSRYVLCMKWEEIAVQTHTDLRWVYRLHGQALNAFTEMFGPFDHV